MAQHKKISGEDHKYPGTGQLNNLTVTGHGISDRLTEDPINLGLQTVDVGSVKVTTSKLGDMWLTFDGFTAQQVECNLDFQHSVFLTVEGNMIMFVYSKLTGSHLMVTRGTTKLTGTYRISYFPQNVYVAPSSHEEFNVDIVAEEAYLGGNLSFNVITTLEGERGVMVRVLETGKNYYVLEGEDLEVPKGKFLIAPTVRNEGRETRGRVTLLTVMIDDDGLITTENDIIITTEEVGNEYDLITENDPIPDPPAPDPEVAFSIVSPVNFNQASQDVNIIREFRGLVNEDKKYSFSIDPTFYSTLLPEGSTYLTSEDGEEYQEHQGGVEVVWKPNSVKRYVIALSTRVDVTAIVPQGAVWLYVSEFVRTISATGVTTLQYIHSKTMDIERYEADSFNGCIALNGTLTLSEALTFIGERAFAGCNGLNGTIILPGALKGLSASAFRGCGNITEVIGNRIEIVGTQCFKGCISLTRFNTYPSLVEIQAESFQGCESLSSVPAWGAGLKVIGASAFAHCVSMLGTVVLPEGLEVLGNPNGNPDEGAFDGCGLLTGSITIPVAITTIAPSTFRGCAKLQSLNIPSGVTIIGEQAFKDCAALTGDLEIPNTVTDVNNSAFLRCVSYNGNLTLPDSLYRIGTSAFEQCRFIGNLVIPGAIVSIGSRAFSGCTGFIGNLALPESLQIIGDHPDQDVNYGSFDSCSGLTGIVTIPSGVATVSSGSFRDCSGLEGLVIQSGVKHINAQAFANCRGLLGSLIIPNSVETISFNAFQWCSGLNGTLTLPIGLRRIESSTFQNCESLKGPLSIPMGVVHIGSSAFQDNKVLDKPLVLPSGLLNLSDHAFAGCVLLEGELVIPAALSNIGSYAFQSCIGLTTLTVEGGVVSIDDSAFNLCTNLVTVELPSSLNRINPGTWALCYAMASIGCMVEIPIPIVPSVFTLVDKTTCVLWVPEGSLELYQVAPVWSEFRMIRERGTLPMEALLTAPDFNVIDQETNISRSLLNYPNPHKKYVFSVGTVPQIILATQEGRSYAYSENGGAYVVVLGGTVTWMVGSTKRHVIVMDNAISIDADIPRGAEWVYLSSGVSTVYSKYNEYLKYVHSEHIQSLLSLVDGAFQNCVRVKSLIVPVSMNTIPVSAFEGCEGLTSVVLPITITDIQPRAFSGCLYADFNHATLPLRNLGEGAFQYCSCLTDLDLSTGTLTNLPGDFGNQLGTFQGTTALITVTLPNTMKTIGDCCFQNSGIASLVIPEGVTDIRSFAFYQCKNLLTVNLPASLVNIGTQAFSELGSTAINIPDINALRNLGPQAFSDCTLAVFNADGEVRMSLDSIGKGAFQKCLKLKSIDLSAGTFTDMFGSYDQASGIFSGDVALVSVKLPAALLTIGETTFRRCSVLATCVLPANLVAVGAYAFQYCRKLPAANFPTTIKSIGEAAFGECTLLADVTFPRTIEDIGAMAFINCSIANFHSPVLDLKTLGIGAFQWCSALNTIDLTYSTLTVIEGDGTYGTFQNCSGLTSVALPPSLLVVGNKAFYMCYGLLELTLPISVVEIQQSAFQYCSAMISVVIPQTVAIIAKDVFYGCSLANFNGGNLQLSSLSVLGDGAFAACEKLQSVDLTGSTIIDVKGNPATSSGTFADCRGLVSVVLPVTVKTVYDWAFINCSALQSIRVRALDAVCFAATFQGVDKLTCVLTVEADALDYYKVAMYWKDFFHIVPTSVGARTLIAPADFDPDAQDVNIVTLFSESTEVDKKYIVLLSTPWPEYTDVAAQEGRSYKYSENGNAFTGISSGSIYWTAGSTKRVILVMDTASNLEAWVPPGTVWMYVATSVISINANGSSLLEYVHGDDLSTMTIPAGSFDGCAMLQGELTIPEGITGIGINAFAGCLNLTSVSLPSSVQTIGFGAFSNCRKAVFNNGNLKLNLSSLGDQAFLNCYKLTSIDLSDSTFTEFIGTSYTGTFRGCSELRTVILPSTLNIIGEETFDSCTKLEGVIFPPNLVTVGASAYKDCRALPHFSLPGSLEYVRASAFKGCSGLVAVTIPGTVKEINDEAFSGCLNASFNNGYLTLSNLVELGDSAFLNCLALTRVDARNSAFTELADNVFNGCSAIVSLSIPATVSSIGANSLAGCIRVTSMGVFALIPPTVPDPVYSGIDLATPLHVPAASVAAYQAAGYWGTFTNIIGDIQ